MAHAVPTCGGEAWPQHLENRQTTRELQQKQKKESIDDEQASRKCISISQENGLSNKARQMLNGREPERERERKWERVREREYLERVSGNRRACVLPCCRKWKKQTNVKFYLCAIFYKFSSIAIGILATFAFGILLLTASFTSTHTHKHTQAPTHKHPLTPLRGCFFGAG